MNDSAYTRINFLSHASISIETSRTKLLIDPWLVGSCYWRSWWNYPPVRDDLIKDLKPDAIYITHFHWDHWHGVTLKKLFDKSTQIITHNEPNDRSIRDLRNIGFKRITALNHGQTLQLGDIQLTAYQFGLFLNDSAIVIKTRDVNILNANDCKIAGAALSQIMSDNGGFDFALRSHSSANDRICYRINKEPDVKFDDPEHYNRAFKLFMDAVAPRFAVPFASNHCFLHKDVFHLNNTINDPYILKDQIDAMGGLKRSQLKIMLSGDSWSSRDGFFIKDNASYFEDKTESIENYRKQNQKTLDKFYDQEAKTRISKELLGRFERQIKSIPFLFRRKIRNWAYLMILFSDKGESHYCVDPFRGKITKLEGIGNSSTEQSVVRIPVRVFKDAVNLNMFHHSGISKRNTYTFDNNEELQKYEYFQRQLEKVELGVYPLRAKYILKFFLAYFRRWRELIVYFQAYLLKRKGMPIYNIEESILSDTTK